MKRGGAWLLGAALLGAAGVAAAGVKQDEALETARKAYERSEYDKAVAVLKEAAAKEPDNGEIQLLLTQSYYEIPDLDNAVASGERAIAIDPKNSKYHEWLGKAYGEKASHAGIFSALSWARKTHREFETAVELDERNYSARQALIEFDCSAPGIAGGGEDKARPHIEKLAEMDAAEGHYAAGNCRRQKKDYAAADEQFALALESHPKSAALIYDIGDYAMKRGQAERLITVANEGEKADPEDPRGKFYRALGLFLKGGSAEEAEHLLREYIKRAPRRDGYPPAWLGNEWLGRLYESEGKKERAAEEYREELRLNPKSKNAREGLKRVEKN
jgi:tetratricopeptide (TPR) repeat protein